MKRHQAAQRVVLVGVAFLFPMFVFADVVHLKNGRKVEGKVISRDSASVVLDSGVQKITLRMALVERIEESGPASANSGEAALAEARAFAKAGLLEKAFEAYGAALANPALSEEVRKAGHLEKRGVMGTAVNNLRESYKGLIEDGDYELCLKRVERERAQLKPGGFLCQVRNNLEAEMRGYLAEACIDRNDFAGALNILEKSAKIENLDCPFFDAQLGAVLLHMGAYERAAKHMLRAAECYPSDHVVLRNLVVALGQSGKIDEAVERYISHQEVCSGDIWDKKSRDAFGKFCRRAAFERIARGLDPSTLNLYEMGMDHSPIEVSLYDEAIQFYKLAGLSGKADEMTRLRDELRNLGARAAAGILQRESDAQRRMALIRSANKKRSDDFRAAAAEREAIQIQIPRSRIPTYGTSSGSSGST